MPEYLLVRCPYSNCGYVWRARVRRNPKVCPRCKKRFDAPWSLQPEVWTEEHPNFGALRRRLEELNSK